MTNNERKNLAVNIRSDLKYLQHELIQRHANAYITPRKWFSYSITVSSLAWEPEETIDLEPRFCNPFPATEFDRIFAERRKLDTAEMRSPDWLSDPEYSPKTGLLDAHHFACYLHLWIGHPCWADRGDMAGHGDWMES